MIELVTRLESTYPKVSSLIGVARTIEQYYGPTRYPNALPGSVPFEVFGQEQAEEAVAGAGEAVQLVRDHIG